MNIKILHFSVFLGQAKRHGGVKRSEQLAEMLSVFDTISINPYVALKQATFIIFRNPLILIESLVFGLYLLLFHGLGLLGFIKFVLRAPCLIKETRACDFDLLFLEVSLGVSIPFMRYLNWKKIKYIAAPHNVEFLVPFQNRSGFRDKKYLFSSEVYGYQNALEVLTICEYDLSILRNLEVKVFSYPYYPTKKDLLRFDSIRRNRESNKQTDSFLLLGTVSNTPTYEGFKKLLDELLLYGKEMQFKVVGFGTECFKKYESNNVQVLGSLPDDELDILLVTAKGVLINQPQTTGFLTRIIDLNICSIPMYLTSEYYQAKHMEKYGVFSVARLEYIVLSNTKRDIALFERPNLSGFLGVHK